MMGVYVSRADFYYDGDRCPKLFAMVMCECARKGDNLESHYTSRDYFSFDDATEHVNG